jgi:Tfp pilus assembly protein PilN
LRNKLNLASKPFTNRSLPWTVTILVTFLSFIFLILIARATGNANESARATQVEINDLSQQEKTLRERAAQVKESLTPEQHQTLTAAHQLVDRKGFSWSRLFADLEAALPGNVRVSRISVRDVVTQAGQTVAELDLAVFAKAPDTVTDMISEMDRAGTFRADLRSQNLQKGRGESGAEYELFVIYTPRAGIPAPASQAGNLAASQATGGDK